MEKYVEYAPRPDQMHLIGIYVDKWCRLPRMMKTMPNMGLRAIMMPSIQSIFEVASLHYRSGRISIFGWTVMHKRDHSVATLPATNGAIRRNILRMNDNSANQGLFATHLATVYPCARE
eukprot:6192248-Pleurochrysis_carterae.AAC.1